MGIRGELFSSKVMLQNRTYFFNVKENRLGDLYLNIVESKNRDEGGFERQSVILFADDLQEFLQGFDESLRVLEKATREKRRNKESPYSPRKTDRDSNRTYSGNSRETRDNRDFRDNRDSPRDREYGKSEGGSRRSNYSGGAGRRSDRPGKERFESAPGARGSNFRDKKEFGERKERRSFGKAREPRAGGERSSRPSQGFKDSAPRKKRVVVKKR